MRVAVLILGLLLGLLMFLQTVLVYGLGSAASDEDTAGAGAVGVFMALLWLVGSAFVIPWPMVAVVGFSLAGLLGLAVSGDFPDLAIWGGISLVLAFLSFLGWRGKRRERREQQSERLRQAERDAQLASLVSQRLTPSPATEGDILCPSCGQRLSPEARFCPSCGTAVGAGK